MGTKTERRHCTHRCRDGRPARSLVGVEVLRLVPGFVSTEVDANLSFNIAASVAMPRQIIDAYKQRGVTPERVLIKLASTWEGIRAAEILQREGVQCNMTLLLNRAQAIASAEAGVLLNSPFVGPVYDWHKKSGRKDFTADEDPGVRSVRDIYEYYKSNGIETIVMGASFRNTGHIEALADATGLRYRQPLWTRLRPRGATSNASWRRPPQSRAPSGRPKTGSATGS